MFSSASEIRPWLQARTSATPYGAKLLSMVYTSDQRVEIVAAYSEVAQELKEKPEITLALLRGEAGGFWSHLLGNVIVILQRNAEFSSELANNIINGSWVAPQLAAGFALTTQGQGIPDLETLLQTASDDAQPNTKRYLSAYAALDLLGRDSASAFSKTPIFDELCTSDRDSCIRRTQRYYDHWKDIAPI